MSDVELLVLVGNYPEPSNADALAGEAGVGREVLDLWRAVTDGGCVEKDADVEDFFENAYRLHAGWHSGADRVWISRSTKDNQQAHATCARTGEEVRIDDLIDRGVLPYGAALRWPGSARLAHATALDIDWVSSTALRPFLRRVVTPAGFFSSPGRSDDVYSLMAAEAVRGADRAFVKTTRKEVATVVPVSLDADVNRETIFDALDWAPVRHEDTEGAFLFSPHVEMRHEYRLFLVDGEPVTGAGNIEEYTPLQADADRPFHPGTRRHRHLHEQVQIASDLVQRYVAFAREVGHSLLAEGSLPRVINIDVALGPDDEPLVVEAHGGLLNTGLFATDPALFTRAVVAAARRSPLT